METSEQDSGQLCTLIDSLSCSSYSASKIVYAFICPGALSSLNIPEVETESSGSSCSSSGSLTPCLRRPDLESD